MSDVAAQSSGRDDLTPVECRPGGISARVSVIVAARLTRAPSRATGASGLDEDEQRTVVVAPPLRDKEQREDAVERACALGGLRQRRTRRVRRRVSSVAVRRAIAPSRVLAGEHHELRLGSPVAIDGAGIELVTLVVEVREWDRGLSSF